MNKNIRKEGIKIEMDDLKALSNAQHLLLHASIRSMSDIYSSVTHLCKAERSALNSQLGQIKRCLVEIDNLEEQYRRVENGEMLRRLAASSDISVEDGI